jgi:phosphomevalonate kinase
VLAAGVPGAGGDDAIFALLLDREASAALEARWAAFAFPGAPQRKVRRLHVNEAKDTIRVEEVTRDVAPFNLTRSGPDGAKL